jgi:hypothetical protein
MPDPSALSFYEAYVINVYDFKLAESETRRSINKALKTNKELSLKIQTKIYALLYSTYSESSFMKMILTPYGFEQKYVDEILRQDNIQKKWLKCLDLAFIKFSESQKGSEIPNKKLNLSRIIEKYIVSPSVIRNKIAHGQLTIALNRTNTNLNPDMTNEIGSLDFVTIYRWFKINEYLTRIIEDLIESPNVAHHNHYYGVYQELEKFISKTESWNIETKMKTNAMQKPVRYFKKP